MGKSTHFNEQPFYSQEIKLLNKGKILQINRKHGEERYKNSLLQQPITPLCFNLQYCIKVML